jgi:hypothetical protein
LIPLPQPSILFDPGPKKFQAFWQFFRVAE